MPDSCRCAYRPVIVKVSRAVAVAVLQPEHVPHAQVQQRRARRGERGRDLAGRSAGRRARATCPPPGPRGSYRRRVPRPRAAAWCLGRRPPAGRAALRERSRAGRTRCPTRSRTARRAAHRAIADLSAAEVDCASPLPNGPAAASELPGATTRSCRTAWGRAWPGEHRERGSDGRGDERGQRRGGDDHPVRGHPSRCQGTPRSEHAPKDSLRPENMAIPLGNK